MELPKIQSASLVVLPTISHIFTTRNGGVSEKEYASLNCSRFSGDNLSHVEQNHQRVIHAIGSKKLINLKQVHSNTVITIDCTWTGREVVEGDGLVTANPNLALAVVVADCAPVLFADSENGVIGAAHAGWRGALSGIVDNVVNRMCALGAERRSIVAAVGPSIQQTSYEVGEEFMEYFLGSGDHQNKQYFHIDDTGIYFDLPGYIVKRMTAQGITQIDRLLYDTYSMEQEFFSYRRSCKRGETNYGRQVGAISLCE
ncbi:MAG: peptidoglycan editing factor PgeF [Gammaproteobacteria bacterium]|nr:peptidoglycan editing factor PgeF [Gammaproteobacteria bacterium]MCY4218424.1 peptidoglycan editing factor PgeF [Gammaproteobacteria bacterium]MCY4275283.1 peptidoglycan editing factor PgeF [Gammaproteobacteria bacterium]